MTFHAPSPIGSTDFITGLIPPCSRLGWSALVNPHLKIVYTCFFPGPKNTDGDDIILSFNNLWMQYGGRSFTLWALYEGGTDLSYCLGTENSLSAFANGLEYARKVKKVLGAPATVLIPAEGEKPSVPVPFLRLILYWKHLERRGRLSGI